MPSPTHARARRLAPGLLIGALLGAALPAAPAVAQGIAGPYLAGQHAARLGDPAAAAEQYGRALARDPRNDMLLDRALLHHLGAGRMAEAVALARRMQAIEPGRHIAVLTLAADAIGQGRPGDAGPFLEGERDQTGTFVTALIRAWAVFGTGETALAREMLAGIETAGTGGPAGRYLAAYHLGLLAAAAGDDETAVQEFRRAADAAGSGTRRLVIALAGALARLGRTEEATATIDALLAQSLGDARLQALRAGLADGPPPPTVATAAAGAAEALYDLSRYLLRGPTEMIGVAYARLATRLNPGLVDASLLVAEQMLQSGQHDLAIAAYDTVPADAPEALDARIGRASALEGRGDLEAAVATLHETVARWPQAIDAHRALGDMLRRNERFAEAALAYDGAVGLIGTAENRHWPLYYQRGIALERSKQWPRAEADFRTALELEPDQPHVLNYLGYSWVEMGVNLAEAQAMIERAVAQRPDDGYIVDSLGWVLYRLGDFAGAVEHLGKAVELRPVDPVINDHYGDALWMIGRRIEAEFQWRRALSFEPEEEVVVTRIRRKLAKGLDRVLEEEAAAGQPAIIGQTDRPGQAANGG